MWKDYVMENYKPELNMTERQMLSVLVDIAKKYGVELKWTDYSDRTPDHYNVCRSGRWVRWNPLHDKLDLYELLYLTGVYWLDIRRPMKELCEEIIMYRGEKK